MNPQLERAIQLRKANKPEEALKILTELLRERPDDPEANYQMAWTYDSMGKESEAAPYYEAAIANGLTGDQRKGALLGLEKSLATLDMGVSEFPNDRALKVFRALTKYNLGKYSDSVGELLVQLLETTSESQIKDFEKALRFYSDKLDQVWKD
jgi:tetratricopeptide (TPR) repeat protein